MAAPNLNKLLNVSAIVIGVAIASFGELKFDGLGFISTNHSSIIILKKELTPILVQVTGIVCEALRLVMVQRLLSSDEFKMDPLVSVYCENARLPLFLSGLAWDRVATRAILFSHVILLSIELHVGRKALTS
jgi:hypothetical protein